MLSVACPRSFLLEVSFSQSNYLTFFNNCAVDVNSFVHWCYALCSAIGLSYGTDDRSLKDAFTCYGEVTEGKRNITDPMLPCGCQG